MKTQTKDFDFVAANNGSIISLMPMNGTAQDWINENVQAESWQYLCGWLSIEPRMFDDICEGIIESGFAINLNPFNN